MPESNEVFGITVEPLSSGSTGRVHVFTITAHSPRPMRAQVQDFKIHVVDIEDTSTLRIRDLTRTATTANVELTGTGPVYELYGYYRRVATPPTDLPPSPTVAIPSPEIYAPIIYLDWSQVAYNNGAASPYFASRVRNPCAEDIIDEAQLDAAATMSVTGRVRARGTSSIQGRARAQSEHDYGPKPTEVTGLVGWLSASDLYLQWYSEGDPVRFWNPREGPVYGFAQDSSALRPTLRRGVSNAGRDALRFSNGFMRSPLRDASRPTTLFALVSVSGTGQQTIIDGLSSNQQRMFVDSGGVLNAGSGTAVIPSNQTVPMDYELWSIVFGTNETVIRRRQIQHGIGETEGVWRGYTIGARHDGTQRLDGDFVELLHYDRALLSHELDLIERYLITKHQLQGAGGAYLSGSATLYARPAGEYLFGVATLEAHGSVVAQVEEIEIETGSVVVGNLGYSVDLEAEPIEGDSDVQGEMEVYFLAPGPIEASADVDAHLWFLDGILPLRAQSDGRTDIDPMVTGFFSVILDPITASASIDANLTYWKPLGTAFADGSSSVIGDFDIYTIPPGIISGSSEIQADVTGDWQYAVDIFGQSALSIHMLVETFFLPGQINGSATVVGTRFTIAPHDLIIDQINGSTSFREYGIYNRLNLDRGLFAEPIQGSTSFEQAILGMPVVIGLYQADRAEGWSKLTANLFVNEGGQANCNSRVDALLIVQPMPDEWSLAGMTTGTVGPPGAHGNDSRRWDYIFLDDLPDYYRPEPTQEVLDAMGYEAALSTSQGQRRIGRKNLPCGASFLWVDFWRRGDLEPQASHGEGFVGQYFPGTGNPPRVNVHPLQGIVSQTQWWRDPGYFVETTGFNTLGLYAKTSTEEDQYTMPYSWPDWHPEWTPPGPGVSNTTPYRNQIIQEIRSGQSWHEPMYDPHPGFFHGICGARFISTLDGSNSAYMDLMLKNAMWGLFEGSSSVIANFIILRFRTMTVEGNIARKEDLTALIAGAVAKSPESRIPGVRQPQRNARELERVRSAKTLYT